MIRLIVCVGMSMWSAAFGAAEGVLDLEGVVPKGATQVWSPLFQASWDRLGAEQAGELQKVEPANALIGQLEGFEWEEKEVMPEGGYAVYVGPATREFALETAASVQKKFGVEIDAGRMPVVERGKVAYGILLRELKFQKKFYRSKKEGLDFRSGDESRYEVEYFGTAGSLSGNYGGAVKVLDYEEESGSFILSVLADQKGEKVVLYRPEGEESFRAAMERVKKAMAAPLAGEVGSLEDGRLHKEDVVKVPYVTLDSDTDFSSQLGGALYYEGEALPWRVVSAFQLARFELFEAGARVRVETGVGMEPFGEPIEPARMIPRNFICDQAFFVFLWREGADWPYLAIWVDGEDCLTLFDQNSGGGLR